MKNENKSPASQVQHMQAIDDFCSDAIRRMRGMKSFNNIGRAGSAARGRARALSKFCRTLRKAFPELTDDEVFVLRRFANARVHGWTTVQTASGALSAGK